MELLEERVLSLEELMADLAVASAESKRELANLSRRVQEFTIQTERQMWEMRNELHDFKQEMQDFKKESQRERREMNRRWGELANKMGTMVEDLVAPSIPRILRQVINCAEGEPQMMAVRVRRTHPEQSDIQQEWDVFALCGNYLLVNETRSTLTVEGIKEFVEKLPAIHQFFPEYGDKEVIGSVASLYVTKNVAAFGEKRGVIVLGFGEEGMDVLNSPNFKPASF